MDSGTRPPGTGRLRQGGIYLAGARGRRPAVPTSFRELEARAQAAMTPRAFAYVAGGAGLEETMAANRLGVRATPIVPRMLRDVAARDLAVELFGRRLPDAVAARAGRRARAGARRRGSCRRTGGGGDRRADDLLQPGVGLDGGVRRGDG